MIQPPFEENIIFETHKEDLGQVVSLEEANKILISNGDRPFINQDMDQYICVKPLVGRLWCDKFPFVKWESKCFTLFK